MPGRVVAVGGDDREVGGRIDFQHVEVRLVACEVVFTKAVIGTFLSVVETPVLSIDVDVYELPTRVRLPEVAHQVSGKRILHGVHGIVR